MDIEILKKFVGAGLLIGFVYFILIRAFNTQNFKRKSLYMFISGMIIFLYFIGGFIYDIVNDKIILENLQLGYFNCLIVSFVYMAFFTIYYFVKGYKRKQKFSSNFKKMSSAPTIKNKKEYVYIILKYNNNFLLKKEDDKYKGIIIKFPHSEFFHDEIAQDFINGNRLDIISYDHIGKATRRGKVDTIYYCYKILLKNPPTNIDAYEVVDSYELISLNLDNTNKKILYTSVVENNFDIDVE